MTAMLRRATALMLAVALCVAGAAANSFTAPQEVLERVYAEKLTTDDAVKLGGYVALERFAPLTRNEVRDRQTSHSL
jgi:hypothetical protein